MLFFAMFPAIRLKSWSISSWVWPGMRKLIFTYKEGRIHILSKIIMDRTLWKNAVLKWTYISCWSWILKFTRARDMIQWYNILMLEAETRYILWNDPPHREYKYAIIVSFDYLFEHFVLYQDCKEDDDKMIFVFTPAVIHLCVEYIWNVFHTGQW